MTTDRSSGYWYEEQRAQRRGIRLLNAMRDYRVAEIAMRKRVRDAMRMGETDLLAIRLLLRARTAGRSLSPKDLSRTLSISSASTTILIDRLEKSGHVERRPHPTDRRAIVVIPTEDTDLEVRDMLSAMHSRMLEAADALSPEQADAVLGFLVSLQHAVEATHGAPAATDADE